jgi:hypothetical protein
MKNSFYFLFLLLILNSCTEDSITPKDEVNNITNPPGYLINKLLISTQGDIFAGTTEGIFKSTDGGTTWISITQPNLTIKDVIDILITSDDYIFIIGYSNNKYDLYRSPDYGNFWVTVGAGYSVKEDRFGNIFLCGSGLKKSVDNGDTWEELYNGGVFNVCFPEDNLIIIGIPGTFHGQILRIEEIIGILPNM